MCCIFKQKTAYEMRISDWSSDVCSSDLLTARAGLRSGFPIGKSKRWRKGRANMVGGAAPNQTGDLGSTKLARRVSDTAVATRQIGRASVRERVCKYV